MDRREAIEWLKSIRRTAIFEQVEALDLAIEALQGDTDCISRQDAIEALMGHFVPQTYTGEQVEQAEKLAQKIMNKVPPVTPTERTGEWKHTMTYYPYCSECEWFPEEDEMTHGHYNYCPNCGAKMKGGTENE